jgi:SPP1 gp7 family putative phage head morphogenesis protein
VVHRAQQAEVYESQLLTVCRSIFDLQRAQALRNLDYSRIGKDYRVKDYLDDLVDWDGTQQQLAQAMEQIVFAVLIDTGRGAMRELGVSESTFDPFTPAIEEYFKTRSVKVSGDINEETAKQLRATLAQGVKAGETSEELRARVEQVMGFASTTRADRIAHTEVARAQGYADITAWGQSGLVSGKEWFTAEDEHVCPFCEDLDHQVFGLNENIFNKGDSLTVGDKTQQYNYDDVPSPPLHVSCRCVLLAVR